MQTHQQPQATNHRRPTNNPKPQTTHMQPQQPTNATKNNAPQPSPLKPAHQLYRLVIHHHTQPSPVGDTPSHPTQPNPLKPAQGSICGRGYGYLFSCHHWPLGLTRTKSIKFRSYLQVPAIAKCISEKVISIISKYATMKYNNDFCS
ncbi:hypothetical protein CMV_005784 [Castanea mollissima]|uniref:Uncharacterized protein n=1 Tax=Castanea mollissima TaxID=60419 RepID=A0A8J4RPS6_9ROSI|nr:hypothetical protein CMV_005784 [Castanea mollissima]